MQIARPGIACVLLALATACPLLAGQSGGVNADGGIAYSFTHDNLQPPYVPPFTAAWKTTYLQVLLDGTRVTHTSTTKAAYDSQGRSYHETSTVKPDYSTSPPTLMIDVSDPVRRVDLHWDTTSKRVTVRHWPEPRPQPSVEQPPNPEPAPAAKAVPPPARPRVDGPDDLGTRTIANMEAKGIRSVEVVAKGREGNDRPITVVHELWSATEFPIEVLRIARDPLNGTKTTELTSLDRGDPDPSLFQPPADYQVTDVYPGDSQ